MKRKQIECPGCAKTYSSVVSLNDHIRRLHHDVQDELQNIVKAGQWRCTQFQCVMSSAGCMEVCKSRNELLKHLETNHDIMVDWVELYFKNFSEFDQYRVSLRSKGHFFIKATSRRKGRTASEEPFVLFRCNREGQKVDRKGAKDMKNSIKIGTFCTAYLKIFFRGDGTIRCAGSLTHCNHAINYRVKEIDGGISGRLQVIEDEEQGDVAEMKDVTETVVMEETEEIQVPGEVNELHIVHEQIGDEEMQTLEETAMEETYEVAEVTQIEEDQDAPVLVVTQEDSCAHRSLNALVEDTIVKLQKIQEQRTGQRLIFYADALQQLVRSAHESISKTIMEHLQKNKARKQATVTAEQS